MSLIEICICWEKKEKEEGEGRGMLDSKYDGTVCKSKEKMIIMREHVNE